ncbi:hypothetical protein D9M69_674650 [compost metagenome]
MWVNLVALQHVLHQSAPARDDQPTFLHAVVRLDDSLLVGLQAWIRLDQYFHFGRPAFVGIAAILGRIQYFRLAAKTAQHEVPIVTILLAIGPHMPAHAGVDQRVRGDQAGFGERVGQ